MIDCPVFAIDPGPEVSSWVRLDGRAVLDYSLNEENEALLDRLATYETDAVVIEMIAPYGKPVGAEVFETCVVTGRLFQVAVATSADAHLMTRIQVKKHLGLPPSSGDPEVRAELLRIWGGEDKALGTKKAMGPLFGITSHCWAALAVAVARQRSGVQR